MRVAIIHYWLVTWRGGEHVLKALADLYPEADIYSHVVDRDLVARNLPGRTVKTTFISRLPFAKRHYQRYLPLMPAALEHLNLQEYDLVIASEAGPAKGVIVAPGATSVCYCHSPMRYLWDRYHDYMAPSGSITKHLAVPLAHYLRAWDQLSAQRVDDYIANSKFVAQRINKYYRRSATVIYPPVRVQEFDFTSDSEDFYLWVGQLVPYKRPDVLIEAFNLLRKPLTVIGDGPLLSSVRRKANSNIRILGKQPFEVIKEHYARCRALVFPGIEDFGIVPVEAMASGKPVIAYGYGGARETVLHGTTGYLYGEPSTQSLMDAIEGFERNPPLDRFAIRAHAERFSEDAFKHQFQSHIQRLLGD